MRLKNCRGSRYSVGNLIETQLKSIWLLEIYWDSNFSDSSYWSWHGREQKAGLQADLKFRALKRPKVNCRFELLILWKDFFHTKIMSAEIKKYVLISYSVGLYRASILTIVKLTHLKKSDHDLRFHWSSFAVPVSICHSCLAEICSKASDFQKSILQLARVCTLIEFSIGFWTGFLRNSFPEIRKRE